ncbi:hypothetical protein FVEG_03097 [Fusarium verticillioides 7600]|uniref:Uncharacterized protein n=1 Tax=Gibberella moniliformis (strain M3125 / FGSC 7600) TaxID=334819 RepID=W7LZU6_GIBM7|nr:hypothetical protein FVEG_03097 [Fusarium verticillioides 7600]EWG40840.1 hypothetical protein FVEG_03097 [Fusarium verticillioides 7600]
MHMRWDLNVIYNISASPSLFLFLTILTQLNKHITTYLNYYTQNHTTTYLCHTFYLKTTPTSHPHTNCGTNPSWLPQSTSCSSATQSPTPQSPLYSSIFKTPTLLYSTQHKKLALTLRAPSPQTETSRTHSPSHHCDGRQPMAQQLGLSDTP